MKDFRTKWFVFAGLALMVGLAVFSMSRIDFQFEPGEAFGSQEKGGQLKGSDPRGEPGQKAPKSSDQADDPGRLLNHEVPGSIDIDETEFVESILSNSYKRTLYRELCEETEEYGSRKLIEDRSSSVTRSNTQQEAYENIVARCNLWESHTAKGTWDSGSSESNETEEELLKLTNFNRAGRADIEAARELLTSHSINSVLEAVWILLTYDQEFQLQVAQSVGSNSPNYARDVTRHLVSFTKCKLEQNCGATGITMMKRCTLIERACGHSMYSYLRLSFSDNHLADIENMSNYIYWLVLESRY